MGKFRIEVEKLAQSHLKLHYKSGNKSIIRKIEKIFIELSETPFEGEGKPEKLKHELAGYWSRRISGEHRLVYKVEENIVTVLVISAMGHYGDK